MRMVADSNVVQTTPIVAISMKRSRVSVRYEMSLSMTFLLDT